jgi:hypothetical protein
MTAARIAPATDVEADHAEARPSCERHEQERCTEEDAPERERRADADPAGDATGDQRPDEAADRAGAEHETERPWVVSSDLVA